MGACASSQVYHKVNRFALALVLATEKRTASQSRVAGRCGQPAAYPRLQNSRMWVSDEDKCAPVAQQLPVHPAPRGRREGCSQEPSCTICSGTKKGQAKLDSRETVIVTRDMI